MTYIVMLVCGCRHGWWTDRLRITDTRRNLTDVEHKSTRPVVIRQSKARLTSAGARASGSGSTAVGPAASCASPDPLARLSLPFPSIHCITSLHPSTMAYGAIPPPLTTAPLPTLAYSLPNGHRLTTHPLTSHTAPIELAQFLHGVFNEELASTCRLFRFLLSLTLETSKGGRTYPQEGPQSLDAFTAYFFGAATIIGIVSPCPEPLVEDGTPVELTLEQACDGRAWEVCVGGTFYV